MAKLSDEWCTPQWLFDELNKEFKFKEDLCATLENKKCSFFIRDLLDTNATDVLRTDVDFWSPGFMNPPYSNPKPFIQWAFDSSTFGYTTVALVKCDPSTKWWAIFWDYENHKPKPGIEVRFLPKRIKFDPPPGYEGKVSAPSFPSAIVIFRGNPNV